MDPLAAMASPAPSPSPASAAPALDPTVGIPGEGLPGEQDDEGEADKMMLLEDFRQAPAEDALLAFEALLSAFGVKRS
jgi:hypothetical protein